MGSGCTAAGAADGVGAFGGGGARAAVDGKLKADSSHLMREAGSGSGRTRGELVGEHAAEVAAAFSASSEPSVCADERREARHSCNSANMMEKICFRTGQELIAES